jgi:hypothetical protein
MHLRAHRIPKRFVGTRERRSLALIIHPVVMHRSMHAGRERRARHHAQFCDGRYKRTLLSAQLRGPIDFLRARFSGSNRASYYHS